MTHLLNHHSRHISLMPGEAVVANEPVLVSTILGSCIAVTMFSPRLGVGAICHAMLPEPHGRPPDLRYVDTAIHYIYRKAKAYGTTDDLEIKLFGGSQVLYTAADRRPTCLSVGPQNVARAREILHLLGLTVGKTDIGGNRGRKLYFSVLNGDVYLSHLGASPNPSGS